MKPVFDLVFSNYKIIIGCLVTFILNWILTKYKISEQSKKNISELKLKQVLDKNNPLLNE